MTIFLDTANLEEISRFSRMGVIRGVTTNPSIILSEKINESLEDRIKRICDIVHPYPVSVETASITKEDMINDALLFSSWRDNIVVKVTIHGPNGELDNVETIHELETLFCVNVNATAMMNAQQCLLASLAGASYVSIFGGRINNMGYNACSEISKLHNLLSRYDLKSKIIVGSTREVLNIVEWLEAGADIITVTPKLLEQTFVHPYTKETVQMFLRDANT